MKESQKLYAEARRLVKKQREHRGWVKTKAMDGEPALILGPAVADAETWERAGRIIHLRRTAARLAVAERAATTRG